MRYSKTKKAVAALALALSGFGIAQVGSVASAIGKEDPRPSTRPVDASPYDVLCRISCAKG